MSGVDFGNNIPNEPINTNNQTEQTIGSGDWFDGLLRSGFIPKVATPFVARKVTTRRYTVIRRKNDVTVRSTNISAITASKMRKDYRIQGYTVDLIEESSLSGELKYYPEPKCKIPAPIPYPTKAQASIQLVKSNKLASLRALKMSRVNAVQNAKKERNKTTIYDNTNSSMVFSGNWEIAYPFIIAMMKSGKWTANRYTVYLPSHIWNKLRVLPNGAGHPY